MMAIQITKPNQIEVVERQKPGEPGAGRVLVRVKAAGICGSDVHIYHGTNKFATYPRIPGHEFAGEIVQVGAGVTDLKVGDRVAVDPVVSCGQCYACGIGRHNVCKTVNVLGVHRDGGFQEYVEVEAAKAYKLPDKITWEQAAMVEPFSIAAQSTAQGRLTASDTVLICGAGPIGLVILQAAKMVGAKVAIMDVVDSRLERAKEMGADLVINSRRTDAAEEMMRFSDGDGASLIFEATGNIPVLEMCINKIAANAGRVVVLGMSPEPARIAPVEFMRRELEVIGTRLNRNMFPQVIRWFSEGLVDADKLISHTFAAKDAQRALELIDNHPDDVCKVILKF